jgi:2-oxoglutarate ferredoxin oxidoreductase subunit beta
VTYNKINTYPWFKQRVYKLEEAGDYDTSDVAGALSKSFEWGDRIPLGVFYRDEQPVYEDSEPALKERALVRHKLGLEKEVFASLVEEFL